MENSSFLESTSNDELSFNSSSVHKFLSALHTALEEPLPANFSATDMLSNNTDFTSLSNGEVKTILKTLLYKLYLKQKSESLYNAPFPILVLLSLLYGLISVLSLFGNGLVIWLIMISKKMRTDTNMYIANLAVADIIIGLLVAPFHFHAAILQRWVLPEFLCPLCPFFQILAVNLSVFTLCVIALDRYRAVLYPLSVKTSQQVPALIISVIWIIALVLAFPTYYDYKVIIKQTLFTEPHSLCVNVNLSSRLRLFYNLALFTVQYIFPLVIISVAYFRMAVSLWGRAIPGNQEQGRDAAVLREKKRAIKTLTLVVLLFGVCWLPLQLYNVVQYIFPRINYYPYINIIWFAIHLLAMSNSFVNPFIYAVYNDKFQKEIKGRLKSWQKHGCCTIGKSNVECRKGRVDEKSFLDRVESKISCISSSTLENGSKHP